MFSLLLAIIYMAFISLGLPDSLLGSAWPVMVREMDVPLSYAGIVSTIISGSTILSSLFFDKLNRRWGTGLVTAVSVMLTALALFGFSLVSSFAWLCILAVPYGLGAGAVDAALNNYVALHYKAQHMSWLHCAWGVGASVSPYIMSFSLVQLDNWNDGYRMVAAVQTALAIGLFLSLPLWKKQAAADKTEDPQGPPLTFKQILSIRGAIPCFLAFFCYCSLELTASLWASSYLVQSRGIDTETASAFASLFFIGLTLGRGINGFLAMRFSDRTLIRVGLGIIAAGILLVGIPFYDGFALAGFIVIGLGCAPVYPCIIHMTPDVFGRDNAQAMIGLQMAFAYTGFCVMPPVFGVIAEQISISLLPLYLAVLLILMAVMHELVIAKTKKT